MSDLAFEDGSRYSHPCSPAAASTVSPPQASQLPDCPQEMKKGPAGALLLRARAKQCLGPQKVPCLGLHKHMSCGPEPYSEVSPQGHGTRWGGSSGAESGRVRGDTAVHILSLPHHVNAHHKELSMSQGTSLVLICAVSACTFSLQHHGKSCLSCPCLLLELLGSACVWPAPGLPGMGTWEQASRAQLAKSSDTLSLGNRVKGGGGSPWSLASPRWVIHMVL